MIVTEVEIRKHRYRLHIVRTEWLQLIGRVVCESPHMVATVGIKNAPTGRSRADGR